MHGPLVLHSEQISDKVSGGDVEHGGRRLLDLPKQCIPYVSQYSDCNAFNRCEGCTKCLCSTEGVWDCQSVKMCNEGDEDLVDDEMFDAAIDKLDYDMKSFKKKQEKFLPSLTRLLKEGLINKKKKFNDIVGKNQNSDNLIQSLGINEQSNEIQNSFVKKSKNVLKHNYEPNLKITNGLWNENKSNNPKDMKLALEMRPPPAEDSKSLVPQPPSQRKPGTGDSLEEMRYFDPIKSLKQFRQAREKRSPAKKNVNNKHSKRSAEKTSTKRLPRHSSQDNNTVKFYSTVDELNEDTLKHSNISGTLTARRMDLNVLPDNSRRLNTVDKINTSLHIDSKIYNHITDNKIDLFDQDNKFDLSHEKLNAILGNHSQVTKDKELSKLVVNELKPGREIVGDSNAPVTSNITFTSENDTLTAMAYIAGNLLNKLWSMEKDTRGSTLETEDMKHEKISDLLDLFKEPLNLKQEIFLKNVLERLSSAIDTDKEIKNGTICQTIEEATKLIEHYDKHSGEEDSNVVTNPQVPCKRTSTAEIPKINEYAAAKAISKINNVLGLLKKFENIQSNLTNIKTNPDSIIKTPLNVTQPITKKIIMDNVLSKNEANSLNMFGNLLDKITKVLLPKQNSETFSKSIKQKNMFGDDQNFKNNYRKMFNTDISNMTVTAKDKIVLDYLTHISNKPDCILNKNNQDSNIKSLPTIEGNILLNLSEFFKIKSIADLINLVEPKKPSDNNTFSSTTTTTVKPLEVASTTVITENIRAKNLRIDNPKKFASTKEKLKAHLKTIIEDLIELQDAKGIPTRGNIRIADALPCIYKIMNAGKNIFNNDNEEKNMIDMFNELRNDMKRMPTRRSDNIIQIRPKSAVVLERVIKSLGEKAKNTRRLLNMKDFKPFDEVKKTIYKLRNISSNYKNQALYAEVPPAERIVLLKVFDQEVKNYITALQGIKSEYKTISKMPRDQFSDLSTFILNSAANITLDEKVIKKMDLSKPRKHNRNKVDTRNNVVRATTPQLPVDFLNTNDYNNDNDMKISRNQIINHLIRKRIQSYMKMKDAKEFDANTNMDYNIAKRALFYLDNGNYNLAQEMYKMLVMHKQDKPGASGTNSRTNNLSVPTSKPANNILPYQFAQPRPQHPIPIEESKILDSQMKFISQDHLIKQLLNIKNMGV